MLARARREAKTLLSAARAGDAVARERVLAAQPAAADRPLRLADAQLAVAHELGARSWPALVRDAQARAVARGERARALVERATSGRRADLRERLVAAGAGAERTAVVMGAQLDRLALDGRPAAGVEIVAVRDDAALLEWARVIEPAELRARAVAVLASLGLGANAPLQHRLARRGDAVVGAASFLRHGDTVLGRELAVLAPERLAGIGRALVQACAREALAGGARIGLAAPTPDTIAFYRLLGFALRPWPRDRSFHLPPPRG